jgi:hypothetical protein
MAEKSAKKKQKKAADTSVLGSLPATRPTRLGGGRRAATPPPATATEPPAARPRATAAKPKATKATATKASASKPKAAKAAKAAKPASSAPPAGWQVPSDGRRRGGGPAEVVTTAVQAAGELAQIGLTVGGQILKRAAGRIPRP